MIPNQSRAVTHDPPGSSTTTEATFYFHPRASNPELWRTSLPLVVSLRCAFHKGLIATWMAIHWLMVLHAGNGCGSFSMREIAQKANVGRNELAGKHGYIQRLVQLGLLHIVGYQRFPGLHEPRPIYQIDLAELERLSIESVPEVLRQHNLPPPPRPAPDPRQLRLFEEEVPTPENGTVSQTHASVMPENRTAMHLNGPGMQRDTPENGTAMHLNGPDMQRGMPENGTVMHRNGTDHPRVSPNTPENGTVLPSNTPAVPSSGTADARNRDMEGRREGRKEGGREDTPTPTPDLHQLTATIAQVVIETLRSQGVISMQQEASVAARPCAPDGAPALPGTLTALWQGDATHVAQRDQHQLDLLAAEYDAKTGGYGAYWVGRAILTADTCLREKGRALTLNYVRGILRRWEQEASWGSELVESPVSLSTSRPPAPTGRAAPPAEPELPAEPASAATSAPPSTPTPQSSAAHPALAAYTAAFGRTPNAVQSTQIIATVTDLALWQRVLTEWQANGWKEAAVAKMLDRYRKEAGLVSSNEPERPPRSSFIHDYPGLTSDERSDWLLRFHRAETPDAKRAVLARLAQEHPREGMKDEG